MADTLPLTEAEGHLRALVRRAATQRERVTITDTREDGSGELAAVLVGEDDLADLEDALALALYRERKATGTATAAPHADARALLDEH